MFEERKIRYLYPTVIMLVMILVLFTMNQGWKTQINTGIKELAKSLIATGTVLSAVVTAGALLAVGHIIGLLTVLFMRLYFWVFHARGTYEIQMSQETRVLIGKKILSENAEPLTKKNDLYSSVTFDHSLPTPEIKEWNQRRWNAFHTSANTAMALFLTIFVPCILSVNANWYWYTIVCFLLLANIVHAILSWNESMNMLEFQTLVREKSTTIKNMNSFSRKSRRK